MLHHSLFQTTIAFSLCTHLCLAQDLWSPPEEDETLDPIIVTASRLPEPVFDSAHHVQSLDSDTFFQKNARTIPEFLDEVPGVNVQKTAHGQGSPYIRGFTAFRNLLLIDGIRFNNSIFREGPNQYWNTIDPYSIDRLELVYGPGSTLYGSDAIGATLNLFSKHSDFRSYDDNVFYQQGGLTYRFDTASKSHVSRIEQEIGKGNKYGLLLGFSYKDFGDVYAADIGRQRQTGYTEWGADLRFDYAFSEDTTLTFLHQQFEQNEIWRTHSTIFGESFAGARVGSDRRRFFDQRRSLSYIRLAGKNINSWLNSYQATLSYQHSEEVQNRLRSLSRDQGSIRSLDVDTLGAALQLESSWTAGKLVYGFDYYRDEVDSSRIDLNGDESFRRRRLQGPVGDDSSYDLLGLYIQNRWEKGPFTLTTGGRYTYAKADIGIVEDPASGLPFSIEDSFDSTVFNIRGNYQINDDFSVYGAIAEAFRAPNLSDLSRLDSARSGELEVASPNLRPEKTTTYEIGFHYQTDTARFDAAVFYTDIRDGITRTPTGNIIDGETEVIRQNSGDGYVYGIELSGEWNFADQWSLFGHFSWIDGEQDTFPTSDPILVREPLSRLAPAMGQIGLRWEHPNDRFWVEGVVQAAAKADELSTRDRADNQRIPPGGTPSYVVTSLRGGWNATEQTVLALALENITNEAYRSHGSGQNEPGFGAVLGVKHRW